MADFREAGKPVKPGFKKLTIFRDAKATVDFFSDSSIKDIKSIFIALFGTSAEMKEINSPMPKAVRRFEITGKSAGSNMLIAAPSLVSAAINTLLFNRSFFPLLHAELEVEVKLSGDQQFIEDVAKAGKGVAAQFKLPPSIMVGQACIEALFGRGGHMDKNSLYGITKPEKLPVPDWYPSCNKIGMGMTTAVKGKGAVNDRFCRADTFEEAIRIWAEYVTRHPNSGAIRGLLTGGPWTTAQLETIAGHMSDINFGKGHSKAEYRKLVMDVIRIHNLTRFDP